MTNDDGDSWSRSNPPEVDIILGVEDEEEYYFLPFEVLEKYWRASQNGGRKSIPYSAFEKKYLVHNKNGCPVHYLEAVNTYLMGE